MSYGVKLNARGCLQLNRSFQVSDRGSGAATDEYELYMSRSHTYRGSAGASVERENKNYYNKIQVKLPDHYQLPRDQQEPYIPALWLDQPKQTYISSMVSFTSQSSIMA